MGSNLLPRECCERSRLVIDCAPSDWKRTVTATSAAWGDAGGSKQMGSEKDRLVLQYRFGVYRDANLTPTCGYCDVPLTQFPTAEGEPAYFICKMDGQVYRLKYE